MLYCNYKYSERLFKELANRFKRKLNIYPKSEGIVDTINVRIEGQILCLLTFSINKITNTLKVYFSHTPVLTLFDRQTWE